MSFQKLACKLEITAESQCIELAVLFSNDQISAFKRNK
jgi:hypothetical protein